MNALDFISYLGFLGLLGLLILILIYILKPNFQEKFVSSTHIWKLSFKYRKKRIPISKIRNLLIIICQVLIVCTCAFIFSRPFLFGYATGLATENDGDGEISLVVILSEAKNPVARTKAPSDKD